MSIFKNFIENTSEKTKPVQTLKKTKLAKIIEVEPEYAGYQLTTSRGPHRGVILKFRPEHIKF